MFATATKNFVEEIDEDGSLISVSSLNDTIGTLTLIVKRKRFFPWQKPKYLPTDFTLNDVLTGDQPIDPVVKETDFLKYNGTFGDNMEGKVEANLPNVNLNMEGKDTSKLQSSFGSLRKEEVDVQKLLKDSRNKTVDMSHSLVQQTQAKRREVFGVVKDRIVTTQPCSVIEEAQQGYQLGGLLSSCAPKITKVSLKPNSSLHKDSNVTLEIPPHTALAYGIIELVVKSSGHYELCLMSDTGGGFEVDGPVKKGPVGLTGASGESQNNGCLRRELDRLEEQFRLMSAAPASTRSALLQILRAAVKDRQVSVLEDVLDEIRLGVAPGPGDRGQSVQAVLDLAGPSLPDQSPSLFSATHLIVSALDALPDEGACVLASCSPAVLQALHILVQQSVVAGGESSLADVGLAPLAGDQGYQSARALLASSQVALRRTGDQLQAETAAAIPALVMCIAVAGLASVAYGL